MRSPEKTVEAIDSVLASLDDPSPSDVNPSSSENPTTQLVKEPSIQASSDPHSAHKSNSAQPTNSSKHARIEALRERIAASHGEVKPRFVEQLSVSSATHDTQLVFPSPATTIARMRAGLPLRPPVVQRTYKPKPKEKPKEAVVVVPQSVSVEPLTPLMPPPLPSYGPMDRLEGVVSEIMSTRPQVQSAAPRYQYNPVSQQYYMSNMSSQHFGYSNTPSYPTYPTYPRPRYGY